MVDVTVDRTFFGKRPIPDMTSQLRRRLAARSEKTEARGNIGQRMSRDRKKEQMELIAFDQFHMSSGAGDQGIASRYGDSPQ